MAWTCNKCGQRTSARAKPYRCTSCKSYYATFTQVNDTTVLTSTYDSPVYDTLPSGGIGSSGSDHGSSYGNCSDTNSGNSDSGCSGSSE